MNTVLLATAFIAGLSGSAHCFGMCGGMASALGMHARHGTPSWRGALRTLLQQGGRIGGYASVGAIGGTFGHSVHAMLALTRLESTLRIAAGVFALLIGLRLLTRWNAFAPLERIGARFWQRLRPLAQRAMSSTHWSAPLAMGLLWGWLPCGLVYAIAVLTLTSSGPLEGATLMAAFGLGTVPVMAAVSLLVGQSWARLAGRPALRAAMGCAMLACGTWMIVAAQGPSDHAHTHTSAAVHSHQ